RWPRDWSSDVCSSDLAMTHDTESLRSIRVYSGNEAAYPVSGWKPLTPEGPWYRRVIAGKQPFSALTIEEIAVVFPDHELIKSLRSEERRVGKGGRAVR